MPSSSLLLSVGALFSTLSSTVVATKYTLGDSYAGSTFLNGFDFFTAPDPTNGFVKYLDKTTAANAKIVKMVGTDNYIGVDWNTTLTVAGGVGRGSVRIETKKSYNKGLFIVDVKHMPGGICGTWPAFWSLGSGEWPKTGEIDIIEGVNQNAQNKFVLHTDTNCKTNGLGQSGAQSLYDCALDSASGPSGCDVNAVQANTFGAGFNTKVGGAYAMEWTSTSITMWFFPRSSIPASITADAPDTSTFGTPIANFEGACDMDARFKNQRFIFNTAFCGDWAGNVYDGTSCPKYAGLNGMDSCKKYVAENPSAFKDAFWQITYFKAYNKAAVASSTLLTVTRTSTSAAPTSTKKVTTDATCGGTNGYTCQGSTFGNCCSASGWCGSADAYCGTGCQSAFGTCNGVGISSTKTSAAATPSATKKVSTDATCGGTAGFTCQGSTFGGCCSASGWCGATSAYCGAGCQTNFGTCTV